MFNIQHFRSCPLSKIVIASIILMWNACFRNFMCINTTPWNIMQLLQQIQFLLQLLFCISQFLVATVVIATITTLQNINKKYLKTSRKINQKALISNLLDPPFPRLSNTGSPCCLRESGMHIRHISSSPHLKSVCKWSATLNPKWLATFKMNFDMVHCHIQPEWGFVQVENENAYVQ